MWAQSQTAAEGPSATSQPEAVPLSTALGIRKLAAVGWASDNASTG